MNVDWQPLGGPVCYHAEGPMWDAATQRLWWLDLADGVLHWQGDDGLFKERHFDREATIVVPGMDGSHIVTTRNQVIRLGGSEEILIDDLLSGDRNVRVNDGGCDPVGRLLVGTMAYDGRIGAGVLLRIDFDGSVTTLLRDLTISNGIDWSGDGSRMYLCDSGDRVIYAYHYDVVTGDLSGRHALISFPSGAGEPDGMTVDASDNLWVAVWDAGEVHCYSPGGELLRRLPVPVIRPTSLVFGGSDLEELYLTTSRFELSDAVLATMPLAGQVLHCRPGVQGRPVRQCAILQGEPATPSVTNGDATT